MNESASGRRENRRARAAPLAQLAFVLCIAAAPSSGRSDDLRDLLPQFGEAELAAAATWWNEDPRAPAVPPPLARLAYRVDRLSAEAVAERAGSLEDAAVPLDAVAFGGRVASVARLAVPPETAEYLEFDALWAVRLGGAGEGAATALLTDIPAAWRRTGAADQPVRITGAFVSRSASAGPLIVARSLGWYPEAAGPQVPSDWVALAAQGVDIAALSALAERSGEELRDADRQAFYELLAAAPALSAAATGAEAETPAAGLLADAEAMTGRWVRLRLGTRRVTRVAITDPEARELVGAEAYWQIDAFGDLGGTTVRLDDASAPGGEPIEFGPRFPVTVVARELPPEVARAMQREAGGPAAVALVEQPIEVRGIFARLWSYETDYVRRRGGGSQIGPLVVAVRVVDAPGGGVPEASFRRFGWFVAGTFLVGLAAAVLWVVWTGRRDRRVQQARRGAAPERLPEFDDSRTAD